MRSITTSETEQIRNQFEQDGFYHARAVFDPAELAELETDFDRIVDQLCRSNEKINARWQGEQMQEASIADTEVIHTHNVQSYSAIWARALFQPRFLDMASAILGPDVVLHHTKLFQKPPEKGAPFPIHQDWTYFPTERDSMIAGIIHVRDADDTMGCLRVYPGSHRLGRVANSHGRRRIDVLRQHPLEQATPIEAKAGDVVFFHYFTLHGSLPNRSERTRKTVLVQLMNGRDATEGEVKHPDTKLVLRGWNHRMTRSGNILPLG